MMTYLKDKLSLIIHNDESTLWAKFRKSHEATEEIEKNFKERKRE